MIRVSGGASVHLRPRIMGSRRFYSMNWKNDRDNKDSRDQRKHKGTSEGTLHIPRRPLLVPRVPPTDYLSVPEIQMEGLFAGYRPLFLGNSVLDERKKSPNPLQNFFTSFANMKVVEGSQVGEVNVQDVIEDLKGDIPSGQIHNRGKKNRKPIIPWDASISGMVYNDEPFKHVPNSVVSKLKPFKMVRLERRNDKSVKQRPHMVKMKVHNSKVSDEAEMINIFNVQSNRKTYRHYNNGLKNNTGTVISRRKYDEEKFQLSNKYKFLRSDQRVVKQDITKLNRLLAKELYKLTNLIVNIDFGETPLPLFIYISKSVATKRALRDELRKRILDHIDPILSMTFSAYENGEQIKRFEKKINTRIKRTVHDLVEYLPSVFFMRSSVDCVISRSPVRGFKRMHWLKPRKRHDVFKGKNADLDYTFNLNGTFNMTRSGVRYTRYPISLNCEAFDQVFSEWDYFT